MDRLHEMADKLGDLFAINARRNFAATMFVKLVLVLGGATLAAVAQAIELAHSNKEISAWTIAGLSAAGLVALGSIFTALTETDASKILETARKAIEEARQREHLMNAFNADRARLNKEVTRGLQLYNSMDVMRGGIEQSLTIPEVTAPSIIQTCLSAACNSLVVAFDFDIKDTWTICIYRAHRAKESDKVILRCVAHARKIQCNIAEARQWEEGVGVAGVSYSMGNEIIIPDMSAPELGTVFNLNNNCRDYDAERYRSMVAVPIRVGANSVPWGVAVVTTDQPHHFSVQSSDGVPTCEPIRAIAAMAALAVKSLEIGELPSVSAAQKSETGKRSISDGRGRTSDKLIAKN